MSIGINQADRLGINAGLSVDSDFVNTLMGILFGIYQDDADQDSFSCLLPVTAAVYLDQDQESMDSGGKAGHLLLRMLVRLRPVRAVMGVRSGRAGGGGLAQY